MNKPTKAPKVFTRFFRWFCHPELRKPIEGDLFELYEERLLESGKRNADLKFMVDVLLLFRKDIIKPAGGTYRLNFYGMFKHNLILTIRNFRKHKSSFFINFIGLSSGIAAFLLIYLWVNDEVTKDQFHEDDQILFQVLRNIRLSDQRILTVESNSDLLVPALKEELAEIAYATTVTEAISSAILTYGEGQIKTRGKHAGEDFFNVFSFPIIEGNPQTALSDKNSIVISKSLAQRLLGKSKGVVGESLHLLDNTDGDVEYEGDYIISGVYDPSGLNTSEKFDFLLTNQLFLSTRDQDDVHWDSNGSNVYVVLKKGVDLEQFKEKLDKFYRSKISGYVAKNQLEGFAAMFLQRYSDRYLHNQYDNGVISGGRIQYVRLFIVIALLILTIACINFINLSTALASRRTKELGVKKVMGASKSNLVFQYLNESFLLTSLSFLLAVIMVIAILPFFNEITDKSLSLTISRQFLQYAMLFILLIGLITGSYPAIFLSDLKTAEALKARLKTSFREVVIRKGLIVFQFCIATSLIICVLVIERQIDYIHSKNLGLEKENIILIEKEGNLVRQIEPFMREVRNIPSVANATILEGSPVNFDNAGGGYKKIGNHYMQFTFARVGHDYLETMGIALKEGRSFSRDFSNEDKKIILNETAIRNMGIKNPIGTVVNIRGKREIIGVVKDFHYLSLHNKIEPMFLIYEPDDSNFIAIKIRPGTVKQTIAHVEKLYKQYNPDLAFNFKFLDDEYDQLYRSEIRIADLSKYFALIAILISCLGLFGLATFSTERRLKEIGIRKVLGAGSMRIILMLTSGFTKMVTLSIIIATPMTYLLLLKWLDNFAYRVDLGWPYFAIGAIGTLSIAWFTVGFRTWKAAVINPVECLRDE